MELSCDVTTLTINANRNQVTAKLAFLPFHGEKFIN